MGSFSAMMGVAFAASCALGALALPVSAVPSALPTASAPSAAPASATPGASPKPAEASTASPAPTPAGVAVRLGTSAVMTLRGPEAAGRAAVIQSRLDQVLLHHPELGPDDVIVGEEAGQPVVVWGTTPIATADRAHAQLNRYSSPDVLAQAWAESLRQAIRKFYAQRQLPATVLYRPSDYDYIYRQGEGSVADPRTLRDTGYLFSIADLEWGPRVKPAGQNGYIVFVKREETQVPPAQIYLGDGRGGFRAYDLISPEETP